MGHASAVDPNAPSSPLVDPLPFTRPLKPSVYPQFYQKNTGPRGNSPMFQEGQYKKKTSRFLTAQSGVQHCALVRLYRHTDMPADA